MQTDVTTWRALADLTLVLHAAYVLFVLGGQVLILSGWLLGWRWTRHLTFRLLHLVAIGFVVLEAWWGVTCPLTRLENILRARAGAAGYSHTFIGHWLERLIFYNAPEWLFTLVYTVFAALVILTWMAYPPQRKLSDTQVRQTNAK
jgi:polyferredoxin